MTCDFCHEREASIFMEETSANGQRKRIGICMECAMERGISPDNQNMGHAVMGLFNEIRQIAKNVSEKNNRLCPVCGSRISDILKNAECGCAECYEVFKEDIHQEFKKKNITEKYTGSMPNRLSSFKSVLTDRIILQEKMDNAVQNEQYEKAAMYRDYLKALEKSAVFGSDDGDQ